MAGLSPVLDAQLQRAVELYQAPRPAEAETAYRELLAWRPDLAEVHVNCALAQLGLGKYREAESSLRQTLAADRKTDVIRFKPGHENRRINITLLFWRRQAQGGD